MTKSHPKRRAHVIAAAVMVLLTLTGCTPRHDPNEAGIPDARADAQAHISDLVSNLRFTDRVVVLGTAEADSCGSSHNWWFDNSDAGYRCYETWTTLAVIPAAQTAGQLAAALDHELEALDVPYETGSAVRSLMTLYPKDRQPGSPIHLSAGGHDESVRFDVQAESLHLDTWPPPFVGAATHGNVDASGNLADVTAQQVAATGATATIQISFSTEYWNTGGLPDFADWPPWEATYWERTSFGDEYVVEIADWAPEGSPWEACLEDPTVDPVSISRSEEPFPYVRLTLLPTATSQDLGRIGECILPTITSGTLVTYDPYE